MNYYALVRSGIVVNIVRMETAPTATGYDLVEDTKGVKCEPGWLRSGIRIYAKPPPTLEDASASQINSDILAALTNLRAYRDLASPTNAQTVAVVKLLCRVAISLIRLQLARLDATD